MSESGRAPGVAVERSAWVQPILVDRAGEHRATIEAAARASVLAYLRDPANPAWEQWLSGPFTKTVRRVTASKLDAARQAAVAADITTCDTDLDAGRALAYPPFLRDALPREVAKAQVSGTDLPRGERQSQDSGPFRILVDDTLTTGKAAAQAAHAAWMRLVTRNLDDPEQVAEWGRHGAPLSVTLVTKEQLAALERDKSGVTGYHFVHDAGWTEVEPGSLTAAAVPGTHASGAAPHIYPA